MRPFILNEAINTRKEERKRRGKPIVLEIDLPGGRVIEIDALDTDTREELDRKVMSAKSHQLYLEDSGDGKYRGSAGPVPQAKAPKAQPKAQPKAVAPQLPSNPILQRIQQGTTTQGVQQAVDVFREENRKNPAVTEAFGKIPTADEVRQGRKAGESAGQFASRKSDELTKKVMDNKAFSALYELFGKPGMQGLSLVKVKGEPLNPKQIAAGIVTSPYDMTLDISVLLSQQATAQEKAGAIANLFGTDLAGPLLGKAVGVAAKAVGNKQAAKALMEGLKAYDLTGGGTKPKPTSVLDEVLGPEPLKTSPAETLSTAPKQVEQMPPPVVMDSPIKGSVGEAVPRSGAVGVDRAELMRQYQETSVRPTYNPVGDPDWYQKMQSSEKDRAARISDLGRQIRETATADEVMAAIKTPSAKRTALENLLADGDGYSTAPIKVANSYEKARIGTNEVNGQKWWTNSRVAFKGDAPAPALEGFSPSIERIIPDKQNTSKGTFIGSHVVQGTLGDVRGKPVVRYVFEDPYGTPTAIDGRYVALARKMYGNDVEFWLQGNRPALVVKNGETVGVIMPMALEDGTVQAIKRLSEPRAITTAASSAPTSARYGPSYGTPQPGQGQRVGYQRTGSVLDEVLDAPKVDANRLPLAHRTSEQNAESILASGFSLKNFGATSKRAGLNYKQDPLGVSFIEVANDVNASPGDAILYADNPLKNPFVIEADGKEWRRALHDRFGTNGDGRKLSKAMQAEGYDGIVTRNGNDTAEIIVFDPATIQARRERATPANAPVRPAEPTLPTGATPEPTAQTVTPDATTPTSARQADINADREALGKAGFSTDDVRKWTELEAKADPDAVPMDGDEYKVSAWSDQETVNATVKLRDLKAKIEALRKSGDDPETLVTLEDKFDKLTEAMYRSGTEQGRALAARRYTMDVDMSVDGLRARYKARAAKNGTKVDPKRLAELEKIADDYAKLQSQIDSGELVKARKRSSGPAKTKEELSAELSKMWDEFTAPVDPLAADSAVPLANAFTGERLAMIGKMAAKAVELGVATVDELVEAIGKQFAARGLDIPDRETILKAWRTERESGKRGISEEAKAARAQRAKIESEIKAELDAPKKAEAARQAAEAKAKRAAEAAEERARKAAEKQAQVEANQKARADEKAKARADRAAADAEAKALREEQERILGERKDWDKRNADKKRELERLNARIKELEQGIEAGTGVGPKGRKPPKDDADLARLRARQTMLQSKARAIYASTQPRKAADVAFGALNIPRTLKASVDISAPGRQGWILGIANPKAAKNAFIDQMRALSTEEGAVMAQNAIMDRPNVGLYKKADLYLAPVDGSLNAKEEAFLGSEMLNAWKKFNPVRASDRAYAAYLNRLRADVFDNMVKGLGANPTDEQLRGIARYINVASGRGDIGLKGSSDIGKQIAQGMPAAASIFWSPRNMMSRIQFATGVPMAYALRTPGARGLIAKEYAKSIIATGAVIGLGKMAVESEFAQKNGLGGTVSGDITSSDFGKIRSGNTRIDVLAGVQQPLVLIGRLITGKSTSPVSGNVTDLKNPKFGQPGPGDIVWWFAKSKMNPIFGSAEEFYTGKDFVGEPVTKGESLANVFLPLSVQEIYEALTEEGIEKEDAYTLLNIFGISTARFKDKEKKQN